jgi:hypothetical protein
MDIALSVIQSNDGGYMTVGYTYSNDGQVTGAHGLADAWVVKSDAAGTTQWQRAYGGSGPDLASSIVQTADLGYIICGSSESTDGDLTTNHGLSDSWVIKINSTGDVQWQKTYGGSEMDSAYEIWQTPDLGYVFVGYTGSADFDVLGQHGARDAWVVKINAAGIIENQKALGGTNFEYGTSMALTSDGGYIVTGSTGSTDGDITNNNGGVDYWVVKLSSSLQIDWQKTFGGIYNETALGIQQTTEGGYVLIGEWEDTFETIKSCVIKVDATGEMEWQRLLGGSVLDQGGDIKQTADGGYITANQTYSNDGDVTGNHGELDMWVVKLNNNGTIQWQKALGSSLNDLCTSINQTAEGGYIVSGVSSINNGDVTVNHGQEDFWVVKLAADPLATKDFDENVLTIYPNPVNDVLHLQLPDQAQIDKVIITDTTGKQIFEQSTGNAEVNVENLASGVYFIKATANSKELVAKFVKQ